MVSSPTASKTETEITPENVGAQSYLLNHILEEAHINSVRLQFQGRPAQPELLSCRYHFTASDAGLKVTISGRDHQIPYGSHLSIEHQYDRPRICDDPTCSISKVSIRMDRPLPGELASLSIYF